MITNIIKRVALPTVLAILLGITWEAMRSRGAHLEACTLNLEAQRATIDSLHWGGMQQAARLRAEAYAARAARAAFVEEADAALAATVPATCDSAAMWAATEAAEIVIHWDK